MWPLILSDYFRSEVNYCGYNFGVPYFEIPNCVFFQESGWLEIEPTANCRPNFYYNRKQDARYAIVQYNTCDGFLKLQKDQAYSDRIRHHRRRQSGPTEQNEQPSRERQTRPAANVQKSKDVVRDKDDAATSERQNNSKEESSNMNNVGADVKASKDALHNSDISKHPTQTTAVAISTKESILQTSHSDHLINTEVQDINASISCTAIESESQSASSDKEHQQDTNPEVTNVIVQTPEDSTCTYNKDTEEHQKILTSNKDNETTTEDAMACSPLEEKDCKPSSKDIDKGQQSNNGSINATEGCVLKETFVDEGKEQNKARNRTVVTINKWQEDDSDTHIGKNNQLKVEHISKTVNATVTEHLQSNNEDTLQQSKIQSSDTRTSRSETVENFWHSLSYIEKYHQPRNADVKTAIRNATNELFAKKNKKYKKHKQRKRPHACTSTTTNIVNVVVCTPSKPDQHPDEISKSVSSVSECNSSATAQTPSSEDNCDQNSTTNMPPNMGSSSDSTEHVSDYMTGTAQIRDSSFNSSQGSILQSTTISHTPTDSNAEGCGRVYSNNNKNVFNATSINHFSECNASHNKSLTIINDDNEEEIEVDRNHGTVSVEIKKVSADTVDKTEYQGATNKFTNKFASRFTKTNNNRSISHIKQPRNVRRGATFLEFNDVYYQEIEIAAGETVRMLIETAAAENRNQSLADIKTILDSIIAKAIQTGETNMVLTERERKAVDALIALSENTKSRNTNRLTSMSNEFVINIQKGPGQILTLKDEHGVVQLRLNLPNHTIVPCSCNTGAPTRPLHAGVIPKRIYRRMAYAEEITKNTGLKGNGDGVYSLDTSYFGLNELNAMFGWDWLKEAPSSPCIPNKHSMHMEGFHCGDPFTSLQHRVCLFCDCDTEPCHLTRRQPRAEPGLLIDDAILRDAVTFNRAPGTPLK